MSKNITLKDDHNLFDISIELVSGHLSKNLEDNIRSKYDENGLVLFI